ncbi:MAG: tol-pal system protein YbgF [Acidobacteria bacterium]|nr:tol-pal system protein YbgF [Acidobacteriota bacterium]
MPKRLFLGVAVILGIVLLVSPADKKEKTYELIYKDVQLLKKQFLELGRKVDQNAVNIQDIQNRMDVLLSLARELQTEQAQIKVVQQNIPTQFQVLIEKLEQMTIQLARLSEDMIVVKTSAFQPYSLQKVSGGSTPPAGNPQMTGGGETAGLSGESLRDNRPEGTEQPALNPNLDAREIYNMAHEDYLKGNYSLAIDGFKIYLQQFPESPYADNALYWIGECFYSQEIYDTAMDYFQRLILEYPQGDKVPAAYLKRGISLMQLKRDDEALSVFRLLISKHPLEEESKIAQQKIKEIIEK